MTRTALLARPHGFIIPALCTIGILLIDFCLTFCNGSSSAAPVADRGSPDALLRSYAIAHETEDLTMYAELLHDSFMFEWGPGYIGTLEYPPDRTWFRKAMAIELTREMFQEPRILKIEIDLCPIDGWRPCSAMELRALGASPGTRALQITLDPVIHLLISESCDESWVLDVHHTWFFVTVVPDPARPGSWVILHITEDIEPI
ncbi:hypothetical protein ACFL2Z_01910 [Candidatus Eisenbacteria bacterium]|uniref:Uncharacterized protein n=1 Tax=Eiseniibacteriota bacterium TaxID=2212470 RepID=A0ABV6YNK1_UNCEI